MGEFDKLRIHDVNVTPGGDLSLLTEFWAYQPLDKYAKEEEPGNTSWKGGEVKFIPASKQLPQVNLEQHFRDLIERCWQKASTPTPGASRGPIMMGVHRPAPTAAVAQRATGNSSRAPSVPNSSRT